MNTILATCNHLYDTGEHCNSVAAHDRDYCVFHLRTRARLLRIAQARARSEHFDLKLPPLESMATVLSAVNQLVEAVAADMLDLKRADFLLRSLRFAAQALKSSDQWKPSVYHADQAAPAVDLAAEYGLPQDLDLDTPPEIAFPPLPKGDVGCRVQAGFARAGVSPHGAIHPLPLSLDRAPLIPEVPPPVLRDYVAEAELAMNEVTPQDMELNEILHTQGHQAMERRAREHQRNDERRRQRKLFRANYERYVAQAKLKNIQRAADKLVAEKLAAEKAAAAQATHAEPSATKRPPTSVAAGGPQSGQKEAQKTA